MDHLLEVNGISKRFGATKALTDLNFLVEQGGAHAIIGENGAGKSTFIKILSGTIPYDEGTLTFDGAAYHPKNKGEAQAAGISTAFQELSLLPNLTISENLALPRLGAKRGGLIKRKRIEEQAEHILQEYHLSHLSPRDYVGSLNLAEKQKLEIARAFSHRPKLILLDEPTAALPDPEWLFDIIRSDANRGMTILYISHRLAEVRSLCKHGTVLRNGKSIRTFEMGDVSDDEIIHLMAGDSKENAFQTQEKKAWAFTDVGMELKQVSGEKVKDVSFLLHKGEILGIAGLEGQGQNELFHMLYGLEALKGGSVHFGGVRKDIRSPKDALNAGIGFVPEERKTEGIFPGLSTLHNVSISSMKRISSFGSIRGGKEAAESLGYAEKVKLDDKYLGKDISALSGGNQQKAVLARVIMTNAKYLLVYDPTRGVDVGTKVAFFEMMKAFADEGGSILWYSTDLSELVHQSNRCLVFYGGQVVHDTSGQSFSEAELLAYATGGKWKGGFGA
jgi:ribose transport system ATP-binding protein